MYKRNTFLASVVLVIATIMLSTGLVREASAQTPTQGLGRINLDSLSGLKEKAKEQNEIDLDGATLKMLAGLADSPELMKNLPPGIDAATIQELAKNIDGIYIRNYEFDKNTGYQKSNVQPVRDQLKNNPAWRQIVNVTKSGATGDTIEVFTAQDAGSTNTLSGVAVLIAEPNGLTFVNVTGKIDADLVGRLISKFSGMVGPKKSSDANKNVAPPASPPRQP